MERASEQAPGNADVWALLSILFREEYIHGFNALPDPLGRAFAAARRAIEIAPSNHYGYHALASVLFFRREFQAFKSAAELAITLNPMDGFTVALMGSLFAYSGDWDHGCLLSEKARSLNPHHPGWYWFAPVYDAYRKGDYRGALDIAMKVNMPGFRRTQFTLAAIYGHLGEMEPARAAVRELLAISPDFAVIGRTELEKWHTPELVEQLIDGLRKAGLEIAANPEVPVAGKASDSGASRADEGFWVAVLPFKYAGASAELKALADGLSEEIVTGLSRFSYLRVIARGSTAKYSSESGDIRAIGKELGARYVMEGSLRQAGTKLRLAVQLVDATTGAHLWAETYERGFNSEAAFELQDDLVPRIVSTVADMHGVLPRSMSAAVRFKASDQLTPYEALLRGFGHSVSFSPNDIVDVQSSLERALQQSSSNADCLAMLAIVQGDAYGSSDRLAADILEGALRAAQAAVEAEPTNALAYHALAKVLFFKRNIPAFRAAADRAVSLNPMDGATIAYMGILMAFAGDWERGCQLTEKGMQLNANHPGWHLMTAWHDAYRRKDYPKALELALKLNAPKNPWVQRSLTVSYAQLGRNAEASSSLRDLLALVPNYVQVAREMHSRWLEPELVEHMMDGLCKAGLEIHEENESAAPAPAASEPTSALAAGASRADEGFWVAVLPFKYTGTNGDLKALAEGLSEEIITGLSRFSYLRVIARGSTAKYSSESGDIRSIGKELGARYVMEGNLRQGGTKLRFAVQLVDAATGAQMWAETYERAFTTEAIFAVQDELVLRIVSTVADQHGVLPHSMSNLIRNKHDDQLSPHEAVLRVFSFHERMSPEEHATVRALLERAVQNAPSDGDCWAMLATIYCDEYMFGFSGEPDPLGRSQAAARRAVELAPSSALAYQALAQSFFFRRELQAFRPVAERAIALNPADGALNAFIGMLIALAGDWDRGCVVVDTAIQLNPHHPGWYWLTTVFNTYRKGDYRASADAALRINMPGYFLTAFTSAAALGQLGEREQARRAVKELLEIRPDFARTGGEELKKWFDDELAERYVEGLRKAGLQIVDSAQASAAVRASDSGAVRAEEGFWVAVLPFKYAGSNADLKALADGLSEEVVTGLSRFSYLRVIARGSTAKYSSESGDVLGGRAEIQFRPVRRPNRLAASFRGHLHSLARTRERLQIDLRPSRLRGNVGDPVAIR